MNTVTLDEALQTIVERMQLKQLSASSIEIMQYRVGRFIKEVGGNRLVSSVTHKELSEWSTGLRDKYGLADATLAGYRSTHTTFWRFCLGKGWTDILASRYLKRYSFDSDQDKAAHPEHMKKVIDNLMMYAAHRSFRSNDVRDALAVSFCIDSGARLGALWNLKIKDVKKAIEMPYVTDGVETYLVQSISKSRGTRRTVSLKFHGETRVLFEMWFEYMPRPARNDFVFVSVKDGERLRRKSLSRAFERICNWVGVPIFRSHAIRHSNIEELIELTGDVELARLYANHADIQTTLKHYNKVKRKKVVKASAKMAHRRRNTSEIADQFFQNLG